MVIRLRSIVVLCTLLVSVAGCAPTQTSGGAQRVTQEDGKATDTLAIMQLASRFETAFDNGDIEGHMATWGDELVFESPFGTYTDREAYRAWVGMFIQQAAQSGGTRHVMLNHEVLVDGDRAEMHAYLFIYQRLPTPTLGFTTVVTDRFRRIGGEWKFVYRKLEIDQPLSTSAEPTRPATSTTATP